MRWMMFGALLVLSGGLGCGGASPAASSGEGATAPPPPAEIKTYAIEDLPAVDDRPYPALDEGRIQFAMPTGWEPLRPSQKYLFACGPKDNMTNLPRITISASDTPADSKASTTAKYAQTLAGKLQTSLINANKKPIESCKPIILGENVWIRHVRKVGLLDGPTAVQSLQTIKGGRIISIELSVPAQDNPGDAQKPINYEKELLAHRDIAYSLAAHMKFPKDKPAAAKEKK
ncbi:hypothetical protein [Anatilimnocola floriformis]|uniref:hypothetical protein n=1 Tax=Anatilimnocola floriformis TaxID=2948575 RepID=UPI0020C3E3CE|nr:hypothetical protein [Anatilimnocola floriformis]